MKKNIFSILLIMCLYLINTSMQAYANTRLLNPNEVKADINYIASDAFKGRLAGTDENKRVENFIKARFQKNGLHPFLDSYTQTFIVNSPNKLEGQTPYLRVKDSKGNLVKEFKYIEDYKEDMLNFRNNYISFNKSNCQYISINSIKIVKDTSPYILYVPQNDDLSFRSSFIDDSLYNMCIIVTKNTMENIQEYINKGFTVEYYTPYEVKPASLENVVGVLKGKNPKLSPIVLSAHFDHIGTDLDNNVYNGALDNASGISFVLEMVKYLRSMGTPDRDILFVGFNAEEFGCLGSKAFVEKYKDYFKGSEVFNFDMIGSNNPVPLCIMGSREDSKENPFIKEISKICSSEKINYSYLFEDASDHEYFRKNGINAVTFCDNDLSAIHTPEDTPDTINSKNIERCFNVASREIIKCGYNDNMILIYYNQILMFSTIGAMVIIILNSLFSKK